jgi:hypothetical protein
VTLATHAQAKALGYCNQGTRRWCERHGIDFNEARLSGIPVERLRATGCAMADRLADFAEQEGRAHER